MGTNRGTRLGGPTSRPCKLQGLQWDGGIPADSSLRVASCGIMGVWTTGLADEWRAVLGRFLALGGCSPLEDGGGLRLGALLLALMEWQ